MALAFLRAASCPTVSAALHRPSPAALSPSSMYGMNGCDSAHAALTGGSLGSRPVPGGSRLSGRIRSPCYSPLGRAGVHEAWGHSTASGRRDKGCVRARAQQSRCRLGKRTVGGRGARGQERWIAAFRAWHETKLGDFCIKKGRSGRLHIVEW